jgi:hypothetical protein
MSTPADPQPEGVPPMFTRGDASLPEEFLADMRARIAARMMARGQAPGELSPLDTEAVALHEILTALMRAGWTEDQAVKYLAWRAG